ncbi:MAG TPA: SpoIIE family protein phosphatase [Pseudonocardiaceae bacterium]|jgi:sigma-B regulation protein RsbU (phosphoserine phosphatase)|nr:SpoIIE family protein phosphatase [Pseudonocardiaceae bacterium]
MTASGGEALDAFYEALRDDDADQLYDRAPCGYLSTAPDGMIIKVNQTFLDLTGYQRGQLIGRVRFSQLLSVGGRIYYETHYAPMLGMQGHAHEIAFDLVRADKSRLPVLVNAVLERDARGGPLVIRTAVFDARLRREYERELLRAKQRAEESEARAKALAKTLQQTLIPPAPPVIPHLDVAAAYRPTGDGSEVGGDFYDVFQIGTNDWVVAVGDVCGKGVEAAVVTALARYTLRAAIIEHSEPSTALATLNDVLLHHHTNRFCTVVLLRLRHAEGEWAGTVSCAGHPRPLLRQSNGTLHTVGKPGALLGVVDSPHLHDVQFRLLPGDMLVLYTDGITEARSGKVFYGDDKLAAAVARAPDSADALTSAILSEVLEFQTGRARDDIVVVVIRVPVS